MSLIMVDLKKIRNELTHQDTLRLYTRTLSGRWSIFMCAQKMVEHDDNY